MPGCTTYCSTLGAHRLTDPSDRQLLTTDTFGVASLLTISKACTLPLTPRHDRSTRPGNSAETRCRTKLVRRRAHASDHLSLRADRSLTQPSAFSAHSVFSRPLGGQPTGTLAPSSARLLFGTELCTPWCSRCSAPRGRGQTPARTCPPMSWPRASVHSLRRVDRGSVPSAAVPPPPVPERPCHHSTSLPSLPALPANHGPAGPRLPTLFTHRTCIHSLSSFFTAIGFNPKYLKYPCRSGPAQARASWRAATVKMKPSAQASAQDQTCIRGSEVEEEQCAGRGPGSSDPEHCCCTGLLSRTRTR